MSILLYGIQKQAFRAQNLESAKSRLNFCAEDIRDQLEKVGNTSELCSQLGAVLGMLGDCWYVFLLSSTPLPCSQLVNQSVALIFLFVHISIFHSVLSSL